MDPALVWIPPVTKERRGKGTHPAMFYLKAHLPSCLPPGRVALPEEESCLRAESISAAERASLGRLLDHRLWQYEFTGDEVSWSPRARLGIRCRCHHLRLGTSGLCRLSGSVASGK